jgi:EipB-like
MMTFLFLRNKSPMRRFLPLFLTFLLTVPAYAAPAVDIPAMEKHAGIAAHKALYDIKLTGIKSGSQIVNISGQMLYEWQPSCDGWLANHRFNLMYEYADSEPMRITSDFSTFESFDGKSLDFTSQRKRDGQLFEEFRGRASLAADGTGEAIYSLPDGLEFDLKNGVFPMMHTMNVLKSIKEGKKFYNATVFDGADDEGPVEINAFVGKTPPVPDIKPSKKIDAALLKSPVHAVRLAFFPIKDSSPTSDYEMDISLHDNGVVSDMFIEYDDFSITQKLVALEPVKSACTSENTSQKSGQ